MRGSIPAPGDKTAGYGGNTPCVEIRCGEDRLIFDLGTGVRELGEHNAGAPLSATIFITHYHYDHLQGLPFFTPMFDPRSRFTILGPTRNGKTVEDVIVGQMQQPYFPVTAQMVFKAQIDYRPITEGERFAIGGAVISALELNHPGGNLAYRVDYRGRSVVFATDHEHGKRDLQLEEFCRQTDLILYDAMYTEDEYRGHGRSAAKIGWGHSTWQSAVELADHAQAKKLVLFHHDPTRSDAAMEAMLKQVRKRRPEAIAAREGDSLEL